MTPLKLIVVTTGWCPHVPPQHSHPTFGKLPAMQPLVAFGTLTFPAKGTLINVYVCVSTFVMPSISLSRRRSFSSGAKPFFSHSPNSPTGSFVIIFRSLHSSLIMRCVSCWLTLIFPFKTSWVLACLPTQSCVTSKISTFISSRSFCAAMSDAAPFSSDHLHRHSRAIVLNSTPGATSIMPFTIVPRITGGGTAGGGDRGRPGGPWAKMA
mmetsp:Transcript_97910/g.277507  ORF Transcript_97910/g.277507 Transcript_97910/m.277507 type:complete len:210 (-) Transcript_97910:2-631(-)